ncbi:hypothetical protein GpartN1_g3638.t1 [Galdieria partita]|uniref:Biogenesis of lysosome-related organelles complex 1 subunit 1 n=1 Tax=Galdieria partita TaxID=83374 RepID=A0A9C7PYI3_9RHOD|nr:hypothetical protein GpartN1_g3638.t1 [Galdieria partita]
MFSQSLRSTQERKKKISEELKQVQEQTEETGQKLSNKIFESVNAEVFQVYQWEGRLESELRRLHMAVKDLSSQLERWQATLKPLEVALKEIGDIENWSIILDERVSELLEIGSL